MGRGRIEIKKIENATNRQVTYSKRKNGIVKKASEITVLCDAKVSVVIFPNNNNGKMHAYHSPSTSVKDILESYQEISKMRLWDAKHENLWNEIDRIKKENDNMQAELRHLKGEDIASLPYQDLQQLEDALTNGIPLVSEKQNEVYARHKRQHEKNVRILEEENRELTYVLNCQHKQEIMDGEMDGGVCNDQQERVDYDGYQTAPFGFLVGPNLQNRI